MPTEMRDFHAAFRTRNRDSTQFFRHEDTLRVVRNAFKDQSPVLPNRDAGSCLMECMRCLATSLTRWACLHLSCFISIPPGSSSDTFTGAPR